MKFLLISPYETPYCPATGEHRARAAEGPHAPLISPYETPYCPATGEHRALLKDPTLL